MNWLQNAEALSLGGNLITRDKVDNRLRGTSGSRGMK